MIRKLYLSLCLHLILVYALILVCTVSDDNVDIMKLYTSDIDHARKLTFSSCLSDIYKQNVTIQLRLIDSVQCWRGLYFF